MNNDNRTKTEQILDLLLDALNERQATRQPAVTARVETAPPPTPESKAELPLPDELPVDLVETAESLLPLDQSLEFPPATMDTDEAEEVWQSPAPIEKPTRAEPLPPIQLDQMLRRLALFLALLIILVNIPFNRAGMSLARAMPDAHSLIIRDGLVLKGSGEKIYVLENNQKRWITTLEAFSFHGYRWEQVNQVDDAFLNRFADGRPIYVLLKCQQSPHIYALENGQKRWIKDIPTFEQEGFVWEDVKFVSCSELRQLPTGIPIPPDAGPSPEP